MDFWIGTCVLCTLYSYMYYTIYEQYCTLNTVQWTRNAKSEHIVLIYDSYQKDREPYEHLRSVKSHKRS